MSVANRAAKVQPAQLMCGIAAIIALRSGPSVDRDELLRVREHMAPRGPDGQGLWLAEDGRVGLAHRRLSIIDLSEAGAQPMAADADRLHITYNGEIYNYAELRGALQARGHRFRSTSDTEVLLRLYLEEGERMLERLSGMFAFALWDARKRAMLVARDAYGIKPLYIADDGRCVRVASQVKALLAGGGVSPERDPAGLVGFFTFGSVPEPFTDHRAIRSLPAGHFAWIDQAGVGEPVAYATIPATFADAVERRYAPGPDELQAMVRGALMDSVKRHLVADVHVGAFLSAGVDSGALVGLMRDAGQAEITTVTLSFDEFRGQHRDEGPIASQVADLYGTNHVTHVVTPDDFVAATEALLGAMDQPSIDGVNTWLVSRAAADIGLKVAVSGLGGDELFGGYPSFARVPRWARVMRLPARLPLGDAFRRACQRMLAQGLPVSPKLAGMWRYGGSYPGAYLLNRGLFMPWELEGLLPADVIAEGLERLQLEQVVAHQLDPDPGHPYARVAAMEASLYMRNQLLRDTDWASMAHGVEVRVPLVDLRLLRELAPALVGGGARDGKRLLAASPTTPLPARVANRSKTGFSTPIARWIEDPRSGLDAWRRVPALRDERCHWSRRLAYAVAAPHGSPSMPQ